MVQRRRNLTSFNACFEVSTYPLVDTNLGVHECHHLYSPSLRPDGPRMTLTLGVEDLAVERNGLPRRNARRQASQRCIGSASVQDTHTSAVGLRAFDTST